LAVLKLLEGQSRQNIPGAVWIDNGELGVTPGSSTPQNLDQLPQLDRKYLVNDPSVDHHTRMIESRVLTSRGCPFNCTICAGARDVSGLATRRRHANNVSREVNKLFVDENIQSVRFVDDLFISSENRARDILNSIANTSVSNLKWDSTGRASILSRFSSKFFDYLKEYGANEIAIGIESGSERLRKKINKQVSVPDIEKSIFELTKRNIKVKGYFVIGLPSESKVESKSTLALAKRLTREHPGLFRASVFIFRPYPGTQEWNNLVKAGYSDEDLMSMHADGTGERSKHEVTTDQQFSAYNPQELSYLLSEYEEWQKDYLTQ